MENQEALQEVLDELLKVHEYIIRDIKESMSESEKNLQAYVALRGLDLFVLQEKLTQLGLSNLGESQSFILDAIQKDINIIQKLLNKQMSVFNNGAITYNDAKYLHKKSSQIFGSCTQDSFKTKVMITLPSAAAYDKDLIKSLIKNRANVVRINTAHDNPTVWKMMAQQVKRYNEEFASDIKIYVDLAGPKNRTGSLEKSQMPMKLKKGAKVQLVSDANLQTDLCSGRYDAMVVVEKAFLYGALVAKYIEVFNPQKRKKQAFKLFQEGDALWFEVEKKLTLSPNSMLTVFESKQKYESKLLNYAYTPQTILLHKGDTLLLTKVQMIGQSNYSYGQKIYNAAVSCTNTDIFDYISIDDRIYFDDGKIGCVVTSINEVGVECVVSEAKEGGAKLKEEKGINFVDTDLKIDAITKSDHENLEATIEFADMYGLSFTQDAKDVLHLKQMLEQKGKEDIAIIAKIETKLAVKNIFAIAKALLQCKNHALMIARGDLAIEVGFENMAYVQEELFDICEAAHMPVVYATQILENKMKKNLPSRAEITDAANAQRADCVMLNKGPYVVETLKTIKDILRKMHSIFQKNQVVLNKLDI